MSKIKKPTAKIVLRKDKVLLSGKHPVHLRIIFNRKVKYYVLKDHTSTISCEWKKWNHSIGRFNRDKKNNLFLDQYELKANAVFRDMEFVEFSFSAFEERFFKKYQTQNVVGFINDLIDKLKKDNRIGSANTYKDTRNRILEFKANVLFHEIDLRFLEDFEKYLINKGNSINTIGLYMRTLRAIYNKAVSAGLVNGERYPFKKYKIKTGNPSKRALTKGDMVKLIGYDAEENSSKWHSLNYFIFSYLTRGMNLKDMALLKWKENILGDHIVYLRAKTANTKKSLDPFIIKIEPEIQKILDKYSVGNEYVFPILEKGLSPTTIRYRIHRVLKRIGRDISAIASELKIKDADKITHYWARHTYATTLKRSGISISIISEALGHKSEATTKAYLDKFEQTEIDNTFRHLV